MKTILFETAEDRQPFSLDKDQFWISLQDAFYASREKSQSCRVFFLPYRVCVRALEDVLGILFEGFHYVSTHRP